MALTVVRLLLADLPCHTLSDGNRLEVRSHPLVFAALRLTT
jgi:hypothetical protein